MAAAAQGKKITMKEIIVAALMSASDLCIKPDNPEYMKTLTQWAGNVRGGAIFDLVAEFEKVNAPFLSRLGMKAKA
jgi:hypothetical protein